MVVNISWSFVICFEEERANSYLLLGNASPHEVRPYTPLDTSVKEEVSPRSHIDKGN